MKASKWMYNVMFALAAVLFLPLGLMANNIRIIGTPTVTKNETDKKTATINFTLAWDNSWKTSKPANWDAAWIFVKCWDGDQWNHAYLEKTGHKPGDTKDASGAYRVQNRYKNKYDCPMTYEVGLSKVYKKWHVDPSEKADTGVVGIFLYRKDTLGSGNIVVPGIKLVWNYVNQGFVYDDDLVVKVFAVEMVYVPEGAFYLGGKGDHDKNLWSFTSNGTTWGYPYRVRSEDSIVCWDTPSDTTLFSTHGTSYFERGGLPKKFPKGYQAFYIMKYELTQGAYCDFLNTLNYGQQNGRVNGTVENLAIGHSMWTTSANALAVHRNYVEVAKRAPTVIFGVDGNNNGVVDETIKVFSKKDGFTDSTLMSIDGQDLAMNFVSFHDLLAYADFAGLRPMTELEYEKACRGDQAVREDEFAWGSPTRSWFNPPFHWAGGSQWFTNRDTANLKKVGWKDPMYGSETTQGGYNHGVTHAYQERNWWHWSTWYGPLRVGMFADSTTTRAASGASYWGVMNMSDNVQEMCIHAGYAATGRKFVGTHGDGQLEANGMANTPEWNINNTWHYFIYRGLRVYNTGNWGYNTYPIGDGYGHFDVSHEPWGTVANRRYIAHNIAPSTRVSETYMCGIRCVRTANAPE